MLLFPWLLGELCLVQTNLLFCTCLTFRQQLKPLMALRWSWLMLHFLFWRVSWCANSESTASSIFYMWIVLVALLMYKHLVNYRSCRNNWCCGSLHWCECGCHGWWIPQEGGNGKERCYVKKCFNLQSPSICPWSPCGPQLQGIGYLPIF